MGNKFKEKGFAFYDSNEDNIMIEFVEDEWQCFCGGDIYNGICEYCGMKEDY